RRRAAASAAHADDRLRLHPRHRAARHRLGRRLGLAPDPRHGGDRRHARLDPDRGVPGAGLVHADHEAVPRPAALAPSRGAGGGGGRARLMARLARALSLATAAVALSGCVTLFDVGTDYRRPDNLPSEPAYRDQPPVPAPSADSIANLAWW